MKLTVLLIFICIIMSGMPVYAYDYGEINKDLEKNQIDMEFEEIVDNAQKGKIETSIIDAIEYIKGSIAGEVKNNVKLLSALVIMAVVVSIFTKLASEGSSQYTWEIGFSIIYLIMYSIIFTSIYSSIEVAENAILKITAFTNILTPCFLGAIAATGNITSATSGYVGITFGINAIELIVIRFVFNAIKVYVIIELLNTISKEKLFTKAPQLIKSVIKWVLTVTISLVLGYNSVKSLILPSIDNLITKSSKRLARSVPVIGNAVDGAADVVIGSATIVKNAIGVGGMLILLLMCILPIIKLVILTGIYKLTAAVIEPVCDKRLVNCLDNSGEATKLLLATVIVSLMLFIVLLGIMIKATNGG